MGLIGKCRQVICITHLAQIAAMADSHFEIKKEVHEQVTTTTISRLTEEQSVLELARILGGALITDAVIENAKEMKKLASGLKKSPSGGHNIYPADLLSFSPCILILQQQAPR